MREGFPGRGASSKRSSALNSSKSIPWSPTHRSRHRRTVSTFTSSSLAILAFEYPFDAYKIICARNTFCCSPLCRLVIFVNSSLSFSLRTTLVAGLGMRFFLGSVFPPILSWIHFNRNVLVSEETDHSPCPSAQPMAQAVTFQEPLNGPDAPPLVNWLVKCPLISDLPEELFVLT